MQPTEDRRGGRKAKTPAGPRALALGWLARRPLAEAEIRKRLGSKGFDDSEIEDVVQGLFEERLLDDEALALDFIVVRSARLRLGKARLLRELEQRGVDSALAERAYRKAVDSGDLDPEQVLRDAVAARLRRERDPEAAGTRRVYNALLRAGFPAAELYAELKRQRDGYDDESP